MVVADGRSNSDGSSGGSGGGARPGEGNKPSEGNDPSKGDKPDEGDKPSEGGKPGDDNKPSEGHDPDEGDTPSGDDDPLKGPAKITIRYIEDSSQTVLKEMEVTGDPGDLYVIQHPSIEGYKILQDQPDQIRFSDKVQEVSIAYRPQKENEEPDQSIVVNDRVKAIIPNTDESKKFVDSIRNNIFSYEFLEDPELIELSVTHDNPLLQYIEDGTYKENDIIYIEPCGDFPMGLSIIYQEHDDDYSGEFAALYDPTLYEVIHGKKAGLLDLFQEGTYLDDSCSLDTTDFEVAYTWIPPFGETGSMQRRKATSRKISPKITYKETTNIYGNPSKTISMEMRIPPEDEMEDLPVDMYIKVNPSFETAFEIDPDIDWRDKDKDGEYRLKLIGDFDNTFKCAIQANAEEDLNLLNELVGSIFTSPENKTTLNLWNSTGELGELSGVDFKNTYILGFIGYKPAVKPDESHWKTKVDDIFKEDADITDLSPIIPVMVVLDLEANGSIGAELNTELSWYNQIGIDATYSKKTGKAKVEPIYKCGSSRTELDKLPAPKGDFSITAELDDARMGLGDILGISIGGIVPVRAKAVFGDYLTLHTHIGGNFDFSKPEDERFEIDADDGSAILGAYINVDFAARLAGEVDIPGQEDPGEIEIAEDLTLIDEKLPLYLKQGTLPFPTTLELNRSTALMAVDEKGNDISDQFAGYNAKTGRVELVPDGNNGYSFECPRFYKDVDAANAIYEITGIFTSWENWMPYKLDLDLKRVTGLETLVLYNGITYLDLPNNNKLKTLCTSSTVMSEHDDDELDPPIPEEFRGKMIGNGGFDGDIDLSGCPDLQTLWINISGISQIDLRKNSKLEHVGIMSDPDSYPTLILPSANDIKRCYLYNISIDAANLGHLKNLECMQITNSKQSTLDLSKNTKLRHLLLYIPNLSHIDLSDNTALEYLDIHNAEQLKSLDVSHNPKLKKVVWHNMLRVFTGNGLLFPRGTWYRDPERTQPVTDEYCDVGETIYEYNYRAPSTRAVTLTTIASDAKKATDTNASSTIPDKQASDLSPAHGATKDANHKAPSTHTATLTATASNAKKNTDSDASPASN